MKNILDKITIKKENKITDNSKNIKSGDIFIAVKGTRSDGHQYIQEVVKKEPSIIIINKDQEKNVQNLTQKYIAVPDTREALAYFSAKGVSFPNNIVTVTGTDGKTSVAFFFKELLSKIGIKAAAIGTMGILSNTATEHFKKYDTHLTTPNTPELNKIFADLKNHSVNNVCFEASSHGIIQKRLDYVPIKAAAFTSFGRDHLDYHKDINDYLGAKLRLFKELLPSDGIAVINNDMDIADKVIDACGKKENLTYGYTGSFIKIDSINYENAKMLSTLIIEGKKYNIHTNLFGDFQIFNLACTLSLLHATGHNYEKCIEAIHTLDSVPGRMQRVEGFNIFIDYAHTPDALKKSLEVTRHGIKNHGKVIVIFGCGGDRDKGKRSIMGKVAEQFSDVPIITDDNPRTENPAEIRAEIEKHCKNGINIGGREKAIEYAIKEMRDGDALVIAGKGHETTQTLADRVIEFNDYKVAKFYAKKYLK